MTVTIPETAALRRKLASCLNRRVQLILDPRVTAVEDPQAPTGVMVAASSVTDMMGLWQSDEEYVDTLRRRQRFSHDGQEGWLVTYAIADLLDVRPI